MKVLKFGGTSIGTPEGILQVIEIVQQRVQKSDVIILSAFENVTNQLTECSQLASHGNQDYLEILQKIKEKSLYIVNTFIPTNQQDLITKNIESLLTDLKKILKDIFLFKNLTKKNTDLILSFGEQISVFIIYHVFLNRGLPVYLLDSRKVIITDSCFSKANVKLPLTQKAVNKFIPLNLITISAGFISSNEEGVTTTLGREGSDYTAAIFAYAIDAEALEIWSDADGMMTADPQKVSNCLPINYLSYEEALELARFGAKIIYPPTIQLALIKNIPIYIKNTFKPKELGTLISKKKNSNKNKNPIIKGISSIKDITLFFLKVKKEVNKSEIIKYFSLKFSEQSIDVIFIEQSSLRHVITFILANNRTDQTNKIIQEKLTNEFDQKKIDKLDFFTKMGIITIVGENIQHLPKITSRILNILEKENIKVLRIFTDTSERNIFVIIASKETDKILNLLHQYFFYFAIEKMHIFEKISNQILIKEVSNKLKL